MGTRTALLEGLLAWLQAITRWLFPSNGKRNDNEELASSVAYKGSRPNPPRAVAVVWAEDNLKESAIKQLTDIIKWCDHENMETVCVYDPSGGLKSVSYQIQHNLSDQRWSVQIGWRDEPIGHDLVCESCSAQKGRTGAAEAGALRPYTAATTAPARPLPSAPRKAAEAAVAAPPHGAGLTAAPGSTMHLPKASAAPCYGCSAAPSSRALAGCSATGGGAPSSDCIGKQSAAAEALASAAPIAAGTAALGISPASPAVAAAVAAAAPSCSSDGHPLARVSCASGRGGGGGAGCSSCSPQPLAAAEGRGRLPGAAAAACGGGGSGSEPPIVAVAAAAVTTDLRPSQHPLSSAAAADTDADLDVDADDADAVTAVTVAGAAGAAAARAMDPCAPCRGGRCADTDDVATGGPGGACAAAATSTAASRRCCSPANGVQPRADRCAHHRPTGEGADQGEGADDEAAAQRYADGLPPAADMRGAGSGGGGGGGGGRRGRRLHVLSAEDGYAPVLRAAAAGGTCSRCGAVAALKGGPYREGLARLRNQMAQLAGPSALVQPELVLVVGPALTLAGFPPLSVAASEILHLGPSSGLCRERVDEALAKFLRTEQRFGS